MHIISTREFNELCQHRDLTILRYNKHFPKICLNKKNNSIIKFFLRKKKWLTSDRINPRALRFINNNGKLQHMGYAVPKIIKTQYCKELGIHIVHYKKLPGQDVRSLIKQGRTEIIYKVIHLIADLHNQGIFFRSIHLENLISQPDASIALIDLSDVRFRKSPLSWLFCYRNLKHLFSVQEDRKIWQEFGIEQFLDRYFMLTKHGMLARYMLKIMLVSYLLKQRM